MRFLLPALTAVAVVAGVATPVAPSTVLPPSAAGAPSVTPSVAPPPRAAPRRIVTLGDSVAYGARCSCQPFPLRYAAMVAARTKGAVTTKNLAKGGGGSADVRAQVDGDDVQSDIRAATTVLVMIGANDVSHSYAQARRGVCALPACAAGDTARMRGNVTATIRHVRALHVGPVEVVVLGYWNVVKDGAVGLAEYGTLGLAQANDLTRKVNVALMQAAAETGSLFVSTWAPFKGAAGDLDSTDLLTADGDHPNASGHARIAETLAEALPEG